MTIAVRSDSEWPSQRGPNRQLRRARLRLPSPSGSGRRMSRQELAEAVNAQVFRLSGRGCFLDASYIGKLERGEIRWPRAHVRQGFRAALDVRTDGEIGFYSVRRTTDDAFLEDEHARLPVENTVVLAASTPVPVHRTDGSPVQLVVTPGTALVVVPADHPVLLSLVTQNGRTT